MNLDGFTGKALVYSSRLLGVAIIISASFAICWGTYWGLYTYKATQQARAKSIATMAVEKTKLDVQALTSKQ